MPKRLNGRPLTVHELVHAGIKATLNNRYILEALYSIPRMVKRIALEEAELNGDLAFGWTLRKSI